MLRLAKIQFMGPLAVLVAVGTAEGSALALSHTPNSELLWYINLQIFQVFQSSYYLLPAPFALPCAQFYLIALPIFLLACYGLSTRRAFPLALASHLGLIYASFLLFSAFFYDAGKLKHLSEVSSDIVVATGDDVYLYLPAVLVAACLISFSLSQLQYMLGFICQLETEATYECQRLH